MQPPLDTRIGYLGYWIVLGTIHELGQSYLMLHI